jgi:hypothetical protein
MVIDQLGDASVCAICAYWQPLEESSFQGQCRRHAPRPEVSDSVHMLAAWPVTNAQDWCGDFSAKGTGSSA